MVASTNDGNDGWGLLPLNSELEGSPSRIVPAPVLGAPLLPLEKLTWEDFERLQWRLLHEAEGLRSARLYGRRGQSQHGLDIVAFDSDGSGVALQSKEYKKFTAGDLNRAVDKFRGATPPFPVSRFIIGVACEAKDTAVVKALHERQEELAPTRVELWDKEVLSTRLRSQPEIVIDFFGTPTAERFCRPFLVQPSVVPGADAVAVSEALARTPERVTGADRNFQEADEAKDEDPSRALALVEEGQRLLRDAGFRAHAMRHEERRAELLIGLGRAGEAARTLMDELWSALAKGRASIAEMILRRIQQVATTAPDDEQMRGLTEAAGLAVSLTRNPLGQLPALKSVAHSGTGDQLRLAVLAGETALVSDQLDWLKDAAKMLERLATAENTDERLESWRVRARLLLAESSGDWSALIGDARRRRLGHALGALVLARYARHQALHQQFKEADALWEEAAGDACLARRWTDAQTWVHNRRSFRLKWNLLAADEPLPVEIALGEMGPSEPLLPEAGGAYETALEKLRAKKPRPAAIAAQRALRQAVASADWAGEQRARKALGSILAVSDEPELAAHHLARAADASGMSELAARFTNQYIDVGDSLDAPNYWTIGTAYRLLAAEADLIPDKEIPDIARRLLAELADEDAGTLLDDSSSACSRYLNAVRTLAGIADRLTPEQADAVLTHFENQPSPEPSRYRLHDEDEAVAVARIALGLPDLRRRAVEHLVPLVARSQQARKKTIVLNALADPEEMARPLLGKQARAGNQWAREMLAVLFEDEIPAQDADAALERLTTPLEHAPGVYTFGTNALGDSVLVRSLSAERRSSAISELLRRAEDEHVVLANRADYLLAASNLVEGLDDSARKQYCETAIRLATAPVPSELDESQAAPNHPLGAVRGSFDSGDTPAKALYLAACSAVDKEQRVRIKHLTYQLLGPDDRANYWPTRVLQELGNADTLNDDLGFLAGQGRASRSLAGIIWARHPRPSHLGARLAADPDPRVRRALAEELARTDPTSEQRDARKILANDPAHSVRTALLASDAP